MRLYLIFILGVIVAILGFYFTPFSGEYASERGGALGAVVGFGAGLIYNLVKQKK